MRICVLTNPNAGSSEGAEALHATAPPGTVFRVCDGDVGLPEMAEQAAREGFDVVAAAGGDGTIHEVVNGLMRVGDGPDTRPVLAVLPLGTGNDLARTLALPLDDPAAALARAAVPGAARVLDAFRVTSPDGDRWGINACAGGFSGQVNEVLDGDLKATWGPLAFLVGAVKVLPDLREYHTRIAWDDGPEERVDAFNVVVANGRTAAGGKPAAPLANPEDGLLDVVVVRQGSAVDIVRLAALVFAGDYLTDDRVLHRRARRLTVESTPGMWFNVDGELLTNRRVTFEVAPRALRVVVGEGYVAEVPPGPEEGGRADPAAPPLSVRQPLRVRGFYRHLATFLALSALYVPASVLLGGGLAILWPVGLWGAVVAVHAARVFGDLRRAEAGGS